MRWSTPPAMTIDQNKQYTANITTNYGNIIVQLFAQEDPITVNNFVFLSQQGFYDGVNFFRVIKDYWIQTGDPTGMGGGGPGYKIPDEKVTRNYTAGTLAMLNAGPEYRWLPIFYHSEGCYRYCLKKIYYFRYNHRRVRCGY